MYESMDHTEEILSLSVFILLSIWPGTCQVRLADVPFAWLDCNKWGALCYVSFIFVEKHFIVGKMYVNCKILRSGIISL